MYKKLVSKWFVKKIFSFRFSSCMKFVCKQNKIGSKDITQNQCESINHVAAISNKQIYIMLIQISRLITIKFSCLNFFKQAI